MHGGDVQLSVMCIWFQLSGFVLFLFRFVFRCVLIHLSFCCVMVIMHCCVFLFLFLVMVLFVSLFCSFVVANWKG